MIKISFTFATAFLLTATNLFSIEELQGQTAPGKQIKFKKHLITTDFISEGSAVGDINKDGKLDIIAGAYWFEAPTWKQHEIAKPVKKYDWKVEYSNSFLNHAMDINQDGWMDVIRVDFPGEAA
ncbi:MAG TPA: FG-GAP repeat protein, partial [Pedobacter sp.]